MYLLKMSTFVMMSRSISDSKKRSQQELSADSNLRACVLVKGFALLQGKSNYARPVICLTILSEFNSSHNAIS